MEKKPTPETHDFSILKSVLKDSKPEAPLETKAGLSAPGYTGPQIEREIKKDPNFYERLNQGSLQDDKPVSSAIKFRLKKKNPDEKFLDKYAFKLQKYPEYAAVQMPIFPDEFGGGKSKRTTKRNRKNNKRKTIQKRKHKKTNKKNKKAKKQSKRRKN